MLYFGTGDVMFKETLETTGEARALRVLIIGGTGVTPAVRAYRDAPEVTLEKGLKGRGVEVNTRQHDWEFNGLHWDIVHVHHVAHQAVVQSIHASGSRVVFTRHQTNESPSFSRRAALWMIDRRADGVVTLSAAERTMTLKRVPAERVFCIPNGVDSLLFPFLERDLPPRNAVWNLLYVGQLVPLKNVDILLRAISSLGPDTPVQLRLVYHNGEMEFELRKLVEDLGIQNQVEFVGRVAHEKLAEFHRWAHALVLPSSSEALPSSVTEAMFSGVPIIASAVGGIPEQLNGFGTLVEPNNFALLAEAIRWVTSNYGAALRNAESASESSRARYSVDAMIDGHLALYRALLSRPRRPTFRDRK